MHRSRNEDQGPGTVNVSPLPEEARRKEPPQAGDGANSMLSRKRNAFSELMSSRPKQAKPEVAQQKDTNGHPNERSSFRSGLLAYITDPGSFPPGTIVRETEHTILIRDLYPKALVHLLLLPRDPKWYRLTPFEAFNPIVTAHEEFLELMRSEASSAAKLAASELSRLLAPYSASCKARNEALDSDDPPAELPSGRDFLEEIKIGCHAQPSMSTLHIHILSSDNHSSHLKHKKHYNSFNTNFFIPLEDFPLMAEDNLMSVVEQESLLKGDMRCWRCNENFSNKFKHLKEHLTEEYEQWKQI